MNIQDVLLIYDYNYWANNCILTASEKVSAEQYAAPASFPFGGLRGTLVHILNAEYGWQRIFQSGDGAAPDLTEEQFPTLAGLQERWREEEKAMRAYLAGLHDEDLPGPLRYKNNSGVNRERVLWHCLLHVVNHGTQHRSEAAALLTDYSQSPGDLDFTVFLNDYKKP